jgi:hypothetical protein
MAKKKKTGEILLIAGAAIAGWYFFLGPGRTPTPTASIPDNSNPQPLLGPVAIPVPGANVTSAAGSNPYATQAQQATIFSWIKWLGAADQAQFFAQWPSMTAGDVANLMAWSGGQTGGSAWDQWRQKYQIDIA